MIHPTADIDERAIIGENVSIWNWAQVRENAEIGGNCIISKGVYIDAGVVIGENTKIQNNVSIFHGVRIGTGVFVGPHVCFTNDLRPRAINPDGTQKTGSDWSIGATIVGDGASLGANCTIIAGNNIGRFAMVGAGSVVTRSVPDFALVLGNPARIVGYVCYCGYRLALVADSGKCEKCGAVIKIAGRDH